MAMRLDPAGHDDLAGGVDHILRVRDRLGDGDDAPVADADIGTKAFGRGRKGAATDCQIMCNALALLAVGIDHPGLRGDPAIVFDPAVAFEIEHRCFAESGGIHIACLNQKLVTQRLGFL